MVYNIAMPSFMGDAIVSKKKKKLLKLNSVGKKTIN